MTASFLGTWRYGKYLSIPNVKSTRITKTEKPFGTQSFKLFFSFLEDQAKQLALDDEYMKDLDNKRHTQGTAGHKATPPAEYRTTPALTGRGNAPPQ